jgi:hypothetical protein
MAVAACDWNAGLPSPNSWPHTYTFSIAEETLTQRREHRRGVIYGLVSLHTWCLDYMMFIIIIIIIIIMKQAVQNARCFLLHL